MDHRRRLRHLLAARQNRVPLEQVPGRSAPGARPAGRAAGGGCSRSTGGLGPSSDRGSRRGRARLPGRAAGGGGGALRLRSAERPRAASARCSQRLKAAQPGGARGALPARAGQRGAGSHRFPLRGRNRCARAAQDESRGPAGRLEAVTAGIAGEVLCLLDGFSVPDFERPQRAIVDGDATSAAIAAASIIAKVTRDRYMHNADSQHPGWGFAEHVGYSTPVHREAILRQGVSPLHRMSFQSLAYQQLRSEAVRGARAARRARHRARGPIRMRPRCARGAGAVHCVSTTTPIASKRIVAGAWALARSSASQPAARRRSRARCSGLSRASGSCRGGGPAGVLPPGASSPRRIRVCGHRRRSGRSPRDAYAHCARAPRSPAREDGLPRPPRRAVRECGESRCRGRLDWAGPRGPDAWSLPGEEARGCL